jgi:methionyl-tRNA formyltransferase
LARLKIAFMGTPAFAVPSLKALLAAGHDIAAVYCQPPRPAGRGHKLQPCPVQQLANERGLTPHTPENLRAEAEARAFVALALDAAVVVAYGLLLPTAFLEAPRLGCLNVHASLLPRWRGAAPIQRALLAGDTKTGISLMRMNEGLDTGDVLLMAPEPIRPDDTAAGLSERLAMLGARLVVEGLEGLAAGRLTSRPQDESAATYARKLTREEGRLDWRQPAAALERQTRAFDPWPGTWFELAGEQARERVRVLQAAVGEPAAGPPGRLAFEPLGIVCGDGLTLDLLTVQRAGRRAMSAAEFRRGLKLAEVTVLP